MRVKLFHHGVARARSWSRRVDVRSRDTTWDASNAAVARTVAARVS